MGKVKYFYVILKSTLSHHQFPTARLRLSEPIEITKFDPHAQKFALYKELKKRQRFKNFL